MDYGAQFSLGDEVGFMCVFEVGAVTKAFEYKGAHEANTWKFQYDDTLELNGEPIELRPHVDVSLSDDSARRLSDALNGGGPAREAEEIAFAVGVILNSLSPGRVKAFEIPDQEVDRYLAKFSKAEGRN